MKRLLTASAALLIGVTACGGGSDDASDSGADQPSPTEASGDETESPTATAAPQDEGDTGGDADASGPSTATVTIDGTTYDFSSEGAMVAQCLTDMFGIFAVQLTAADGGDGALQLFILREGTDPAVVDENNNIDVGIGDDSWVADEASDLFDMSDQLEPGMTQVDTAQIDGNSVSGTATFVSQSSVYSGGDIETATGTFEATCGEQRAT